MLYPANAANTHNTADTVDKNRQRDNSFHTFSSSRRWNRNTWIAWIIYSKQNSKDIHKQSHMQLQA